MQNKYDKTFWLKFEDSRLGEQGESEEQWNDELPAPRHAQKNALRANSLVDRVLRACELIHTGSASLDVLDTWDVLDVASDLVHLAVFAIQHRQSDVRSAGQEPIFLDLAPLDPTDPSGTAPSVRVFSRVKQPPSEFLQPLEEIEEALALMLRLDPKRHSGAWSHGDLPRHTLDASTLRSLQQSIKSVEDFDLLMLYWEDPVKKLPQIVRLLERAWGRDLISQLDSQSERGVRSGHPTPLQASRVISKILSMIPSIGNQHRHFQKQASSVPPADQPYYKSDNREG